MEIEEHPLWPTIRAFNKATGNSPIAYDPMPGLIKNPSESEQHAFATQQKRNVSMHALCLLMAMEGEKDFDADKHRELFHFVSATDLGILIGVSAASARRNRRFFRAFSESTRLPGFMDAVAAAQNASKIRRKTNPAADWMESLATAYDEAEENPERYDWYFRQALGAAPDSLTFSRDLHAMIQRKAYAATKDKKREEEALRKGVTRKARTNRFQDMLAAHWIDAALWCRSSAGILKILEPGSCKGENVEALETDITRLKLTESRPKLEARIDF
jgi:hypothetical protein